MPTRARHTPAFAHFYSLGTNTRWLSMKTHTLLSNKTLPLVKIHFCTQETFVVLLYFLKKPAVCMCPLINVGQKSKFLGELPGSDVMADVAGHKPAWEATVSQRAGYGALPTGRGWPPPNLLLLLLPNPGHSTTSSAPNLKSKTATTALARETSSSPTSADCRWLDL